MRVGLGIDLGTSGVRAVAIDAGGAVLGQGSARIAAENRRDPGSIWRAVGAALEVLCASTDPGAVDAIAVDGTSGTILATDAKGAPLGPASLYNDRAAPDAVARIAGVAPRDSAAHGETSPLGRMVSLLDRPGLAHVLHEADWVAHRLGAPLGVSDANNTLKSGYDPVAGGWPGWIGRLGLDVSLLPRVVEPGVVIGAVGRDAAARFGFRADARIVAGTTDGCASFLATGAARAGDGVTALGSTLTLKLLSDRPVFAPNHGIYSHRLLGQFLPGGAANAGAAVLAQFFAPERIAELSARIDPARDSGLDYYPLPAPGERFPVNDPGLRPRLEPRPDDDARFLHGLLEGLARIEALGYRRLAELGAPPVRRVLTVGGGAVNPVWTALRARILGVEVVAARQTEAAYGTARLALLGLASCG
ncbi:MULTISPECIES: FGGY-family carbohydrate kinase [Acidiphilium]|uniref:FGGY-family carbohydrate kinase n=1 Tax=Acidiphilium iwatense TaxID=768198 RepID=A0ABS9DY75_9PROT|nr:MULTISPECIES: FGGY-family carbohydrate kinase [Acidiphilium]MCF3947135.1 FGGY-family carbohydrate kinase [Acidiphilium iwatense]